MTLKERRKRKMFPVMSFVYFIIFSVKVLVQTALLILAAILYLPFTLADMLSKKSHVVAYGTERKHLKWSKPKLQITWKMTKRRRFKTSAAFTTIFR